MWTALARAFVGLSRHSLGAVAFCAREDGSILVETALGVVGVFTVAIPLATLISFASATSRDIADAHAMAHQLIHTKAIPPNTRFTFTCGDAPEATDGPCAAVLARGSYVRVSADSVVAFPFGLAFHTGATAVTRV